MSLPSSFRPGGDFLARTGRYGLDDALLPPRDRAGSERRGMARKMTSYVEGTLPSVGDDIDGHHSSDFLSSLFFFPQVGKSGFWTASI